MKSQTDLAIPFNSVISKIAERGGCYSCCQGLGIEAVQKLEFRQIHVIG